MISKEVLTFGEKQFRGRMALTVFRSHSLRLCLTRGRAWCAVLILGAVATGCSTTRTKSSPSSAAVGSIRREEGSLGTSPAALEAEIMRFGDEMTALISQAADDFATQVGTPEGRVQALEWKAGVANNTMIIASGPNATANLLDMVVFVTLGRMNLEEYWLPRNGPAAQPMLDVTSKLEKGIWSTAAQVLTRSQQDELRSLIRTWRAEHPGQLDVGVRFRDFADLAAHQQGGAKGKTSSVLGLLFLDPFAGLDPATREMERTRYVADRALYVMKRMPNLLRWQSQLFFAQTVATPEMQQLLSNSTSFAQSAKELPEQLSAETRKVMNDFSAQAPQWQALLSQFQQSFQAGNEMATSVNAATKSLDAFVGRYTTPRPTNRGASPTSSTVGSGSDTNSAAALRSPATAKRFDVTEYGAAAAQIGEAAQQLNTLVASVDKITPEISATVESTGLQGKELVDYAFRRALWLVGLTLVGIVGALLAYRSLASRLFGKTTREP